MYLLPFQIGEQYETWEFDLEIVIQEKIKGQDSYKFKSKVTISNIRPKYIELFFELDILTLVFLEFGSLKSNEKNEKLINLTKDLVCIKIENQDKLKISKFQLEFNNELWIITNNQNNKLLIIYGKPKLIQEITKSKTLD